MFRYIVLTTVLALWAGTASADHQQYDMRVDGLTCPFCVATSSKALKRIDGVYDVSVDLDTGIISVCASREIELGDEQMRKLFRRKGFTYRSQTVSEGCTITDITHSETGENLTYPDRQPSETTESEAVGHGDKDHKHSGYGS